MIKKIDKIFVLGALVMLLPLLGRSQIVIFSENFDAGPSWILNVPGGGTNGGSANVWVIDGLQPFSTPNSLHICDGSGFCSFFGQAAYLVDPGAETDKIAYNNSDIDMCQFPTMDITMEFMWMANGESGVDFGQAGYSTDGGSNFTWLPTIYQLNSVFTLETLTITPAQHLGSNTFRIAFRWINNGNSLGTDPAFNVDNIELTVPSSTGPLPVADFVASSTTICQGDCINFTDLSTYCPSSWTWSFPGAAPTGSSLQNPTNICYNAVGTHSVTLVATNSNGFGDTTFINYITVNAAATANAGPDTNICTTGSYAIAGATVGGTVTSLLWGTSGDGTFDDSLLVSPIYTPSAADIVAGCVTLYITTNDSTGLCTAASDTMVLCFFSCVATIADFIASDTSICEGDTIDFTALSPNATSWTWSFSGGAPPTSNDSTPSVIYNAAGIYDVTLTVSNVNNSDDTTFTNYITVNNCSPPVAGFVASSDSICEGVCIDFTDLSQNLPFSWNWSFSGGSPSSETVQNPTVCYATSGTYQVSLIVTNTYGSDTLIQTDYITVNQLPVIQVVPDEVTIEAGQSVSLTASGADSYTWSPDVGLSATVTVSPATTTTYIVTGTSNDCSTDTTVTVYVEVVFVPNVLSPNGTGPLDNKVLKVYGSGIESIEFLIYDRWGTVVYEAKSVDEAMNEGWNGRFKGEPLNPATFVYTLKVIFKNGDEHSEMGNIALVR